MFYNRNIKSVLAGFGLIAALGAVPAAVAASDAAPDQTPLVLAQATSIDDGTIEAFVDAQARVEDIRSTYAAEYQAAETDEQRQQINERATQEMVGAVEETPNITVEEYNAVIQAANEDPGMAERIDEAIANSDS